MQSGVTRRAGRYNDPGDHRYTPRVGGDVGFRKISEPTGDGALSPPCATELPPIGW